MKVPGRVRSIRQHGKSVFADIHDGKEKLLPVVDAFLGGNVPGQPLQRVVPGDLQPRFGKGGEGYLRLCFASSPERLKVAMERMAPVLR